MRHRNLLLVGAGILALLIPIVARFVMTGVPAGLNTYTYLQAARTPESLFEWVLSGAVKFFSVSVASFLLPLLLGIISLILFAFILRLHAKKHMPFILLVLILSPAFVFAFTTLNPGMLLIPFLLSFIYFFSKKKLYVAYFFLLLALFLDGISSILAMIAAIFFIIYKKQLRKQLIAISILSIVFLLTLIFLPFTMYVRGTAVPGFFTSLFVILGGVQGFSFFFVLLSIIGTVMVWQSFHARTILVFSILLLTLTIFRYDASFISVLAFLLSILAGYAFCILYKTKWSLPQLKTIFVFTLFLGLFFTYLFYIRIYVSMDPGKELIDELASLDRAEGTFLAQEEYYSVILYSTSLQGFRTDTDEYAALRSNLTLVQELEQAKNLLRENGISYIIEIPEHKQNKEDSFPSDNLRRLLENNETFKYVINTTSIHIWELKAEEQ